MLTPVQRLMVIVFAIATTIPTAVTATTIGDPVTLNVQFELNGVFQAYNNLAFGNIDFRFRQDGTLLAAGDFDQQVGGGISRTGVFSTLPLAPATYTPQSVSYMFSVPVTYILGTPTTLQVDFNASVIRGAADFYAAGTGLTGTLSGLDDRIDGPNTSLQASVSLGTDQPNDTAVPPDEAHAFFTYNSYPNALARVTGPKAFQLLVRPDGAPYVADFANTRITTTVTLVQPVPLPGALIAMTSALAALGGALRLGRGRATC